MPINNLYCEAFTDDAAVLEGIGGTIHLIEGDPENIKITTPNDLIIAECLFGPKVIFTQLASFPVIWRIFREVRSEPHKTVEKPGQ